MPLILALVKSNKNARNPRRFRAVFSLVTLFVVCFIVAGWARPVLDEPARAKLAPAPDNPSQSRKMASIGDAAFSVEVTNGQDTKVEGKLKAGAQATVEYRPADGRNIAVHVVVRPGSGFEVL